MLKKTGKGLFVIFSACALLHLAAWADDAGAQRHHQSPPLYCKIGRGSAIFGHDWYDFSDTMFMLYDDERMNIKIPHVRGAGELTVQALFDRTGQKLIFCPMLDAPPGRRIACASLYALDDDLHDGIKRTFDIPDALRGGAITCAYQQAKLKKLTSYPAGGN